jgi:hypothetical protein
MPHLNLANAVANGTFMDNTFKSCRGFWPVADMWSRWSISSVHLAERTTEPMIQTRRGGYPVRAGL